MVYMLHKIKHFYSLFFCMSSPIPLYFFTLSSFDCVCVSTFVKSLSFLIMFHCFHFFFLCMCTHKPLSLITLLSAHTIYTPFSLPPTSLSFTFRSARVALSQNVSGGTQVQIRWKDRGCGRITGSKADQNKCDDIQRDEQMMTTHHLLEAHVMTPKTLTFSSKHIS